MGPGPAMKHPLAFLSPSSPTSPPSKTPPPPSPPPLSSHPLFRSSLPPLPPPWTHSRGLLMPPPPASLGLPSARGGREHLLARLRGDCDDDLSAGVPDELFPLKKRIVRYHPYAAARAIQEMASTGGLGGDRQRREEEEEEEGDGLRAELLRLRITRPALVLTKLLTISDRRCDMARLVLPEKLVRASPLLDMLTAAERRLVFGPGLPVPAFDRLGRTYRMTLRRDRSARTFLLRGQWTLYLSRHDMRDGDAVELLAFRPSAWQARLDKYGEGGIGMAVLHCPCPNAADRCCWTDRERDAADGLLLLMAAAASATAASSCRRLIPSQQLVGMR